jgi:hypothetical protein
MIRLAWTAGPTGFSIAAAASGVWEEAGQADQADMDVASL